MNRVSSWSYGYTIVEIMIFLAVSAGLFISAASLLSGKQARTEFTQAVYEVESQLQDIINDVATGYYNNTNNFTCDAPAGSGPPVITSPASGTQGANLNCIFLGRGLQFGIQGTDFSTYNVYTVVGRRQYGTPPREVTDFATAEPRVVDPSINTERKILENGLKVQWIKYFDSLSALQSIGAFGFISSFGQYDPLAPSKLVSGDQVVNVIPIRGYGLNSPEPPAGFTLNAANYSDRNPVSGVAMCFNSPSTSQHAVITLGSNGRQLSTKTDIRGGVCPP